MKRCVAVLNLPSTSGNRLEYELSLNSIREYARRHSLPIENLALARTPEWEHLPPHVEKFHVKEILESGYDQVLYLDMDILVNPEAPNIFEAHEPNLAFHAYDEGWLPWCKEDALFFQGRYQVKFPLVDVDRYLMFNTGVMILGRGMLPVLSDFHPDGFTRSFHKGTSGGEQTYLNMLIHKHGIPYGTIGNQWNFLAGVHDGRYIRKSAAFVHYAGNFRDQLKEDAKSLWRAS